MTPVTSIYVDSTVSAEHGEGGVYVARGLEDNPPYDGFSNAPVEFRGDEFVAVLVDGSVIPIPAELLPADLR